MRCSYSPNLPIRQRRHSSSSIWYSSRALDYLPNAPREIPNSRSYRALDSCPYAPTATPTADSRADLTDMRLSSSTRLIIVMGLAPVSIERMRCMRAEAGLEESSMLIGTLTGDSGLSMYSTFAPIAYLSGRRRCTGHRNRYRLRQSVVQFGAADYQSRATGRQFATDNRAVVTPVNASSDSVRQLAEAPYRALKKRRSAAISSGVCSMSEKSTL